MIGFLATALGRWAAIGLMGLLTYIGFAKHFEHKGAARVSAQIERKVEAHAKTAETVRTAVRDYPAERLRDTWTRK